MKIGDVWYEKHTVTEISQRTNTVSEAQVERVNAIPQKWISVSEKLPENGTYLITRKNIINTPIVSICSFAKNLYLIDDFDFYDKKGKSGWYDYDSEIGYCEVDGIIAWMPLPKPYKPQKKDICEKCSYAEETDGNHCYECVKGESKFEPQESEV